MVIFWITSYCHIIGLLISAAIFRIVWESSKSIFTRLLDGVDPKVVYEIKHVVNHIKWVYNIAEVRVRWLGHRLHAELNIAVSPDLSIEEGHDIAREVRHQLLHHLRYLSILIQLTLQARNIIASQNISMTIYQLIHISRR